MKLHFLGIGLRVCNRRSKMFLNCFKQCPLTPTYISTKSLCFFFNANENQCLAITGQRNTFSLFFYYSPQMLNVLVTIIFHTVSWGLSIRMHIFLFNRYINQYPPFNFLINVFTSSIFILNNLKNHYITIMFMAMLKKLWV